MGINCLVALEGEAWCNILLKAVGRVLHVVGRRLQGVRRRWGAVEDVARLAEAVGGGGGAGLWGGGSGRAGRVGGGACRLCRSHGNVRIVSEKLQTVLE